MLEFLIIDCINPDTGKPFFEVVENDDRRFKRYGLFEKKEQAERFIVDFHESCIGENK